MGVEWDTESAARGVDAQAGNLQAIADLIARVRRVQGAAPSALGFAAKSAVERGGNDLIAALKTLGKSLEADTRELRKRVLHMQAIEADAANYKPMSNWDIAKGTGSGTWFGLKDIFWDEPVGTLKDPDASAGSKAWATFNLLTLPVPVAKVVKLGVAVKASSGAIKASRAVRAVDAGADAIRATSAAKKAVAVAKASQVGKAAAPAVAAMKAAGASIRRGYEGLEKARLAGSKWVWGVVTPTRVINRVLELPMVVRYRTGLAGVNRLFNTDVRALVGPGHKLRVGSISRGQVASKTLPVTKTKLGVAKSEPKLFFGDGMRDVRMGVKPTEMQWKRPQFLDGPWGSNKLKAFVKDLETQPVQNIQLGRDGAVYQELVLNKVIGRLPNGKPTMTVTVRLTPPTKGALPIVSDIYPGPMKVPARPLYNPLPSKPKFTSMGPSWKAPGFTINNDKDGHPQLRFTVEPPTWKPGELSTYTSPEVSSAAKKWRAAG